MAKKIVLSLLCVATAIAPVSTIAAMQDTTKAAFCEKNCQGNCHGCGCGGYEIIVWDD